AVIAVVTMTLSPITIGDDQATPGISTFQAMFLSLLHSVGSWDSLLSAAAPGPRNWGQSSAKVTAGTLNTSPSARNRRRIDISALREGAERRWFWEDDTIRPMRGP